MSLIVAALVKVILKGSEHAVHRIFHMMAINNRIKVFKIIFVVRINEKCSHNTIFALKIFIKIFQVVITLNNRVVNAGSILIYPANYIRINLL